MFDSLLGGKFSKKCKHCVKCINSRIVLIRKKRQATVKFLKKDVADLLANGHDLNAFGRIEALIVEINRTSCYDMIEQYCQCILNLLPSLQKQRECPEEAMEAVSTLNFAAARFSDLPELYDLRGVFTERYGSHMESSVNAEFVEKIQKKSFTMESKLQLMKDSAEEFSIKWDSKALQHKLSNPSAIPPDQPKSRKNAELLTHSEMSGRNSAINLQRVPVFDAAVEVNGRNVAVHNAGGSFNNKKEAVSDDRWNRAAVNAGVSATSRNENVSNADVAGNDRNEAVYGRHKGVRNAGNGSFKGRKEEVHNTDIAANGGKRTVIDSAVAVNKRNEAVFGTNGDQDIQCEGWEPSLRNTVQKQVQSKPKDIHVIPVICNDRSHDPSKKTLKLYAASWETENVTPDYDNAAARAYVKDTNVQNGIVKDDWLKLKGGQKMPQDGIIKNDWLNPKGSHSEGIAHCWSPVAQDGPGLIGLQKESAVPAISRDVKAVDMIPPYTKFKGGKSGGGDVDSVPVYDELPKVGKGLDPALQSVNLRSPRPMSMIPPPYTKPNFRNPSADADDTKLTVAPINMSNTADYERFNGGERSKPISVRRRLPKPPLVIDTNDEKPVGEVKNDHYTKETVHRNQGKSGEEIRGDRNVHGTSSGRRKHGERRSNAAYDGDCDEEEEVMDRLLLHLSKKVMNNDSVNTRSRRAPPAEHVTDASRDCERYGKGRSNYRPERVASLPPEPKSPIAGVGIGRGPFRATSMQPDMLSLIGADPRVPDYEDLAARFSALKRT